MRPARASTRSHALALRLFQLARRLSSAAHPVSARALLVWRLTARARASGRWASGVGAGGARAHQVCDLLVGRAWCGGGGGASERVRPDRLVELLHFLGQVTVLVCGMLGLCAHSAALGLWQCALGIGSLHECRVEFVVCGVVCVRNTDFIFIAFCFSLCGNSRNMLAK